MSQTGDPFTGFEGRWGGYADAETGRFLTRDPSGYAGGVDLYA